ncbi:MAG: hypothetical protein ACOZCL_05780 [Bacillota bacterium]
MKKRKKTGSKADQIEIGDIKLRIGDKLYMNGILYGEVADESDTLFFLAKPHRQDIIPSPYLKEKLIENILLGTFTLEKINFE